MILALLACWPGPLPPCDDCGLHDDVDGDGVSIAQGDCDDEDPARGPHVEETCDNGIDDDCDGGPGRCRFVGTVRLDEAGRVTRADTRSSRHGTGLAAVGDALWISAPNLGGLQLRGGLVHIADPGRERLELAADTWIEGDLADRLGLQLTAAGEALWARTVAEGAGAVHRIPTPLDPGTYALGSVRTAVYEGEADEALGEAFLVGSPEGSLLASSASDGRLGWWLPGGTGAPEETAVVLSGEGPATAGAVLEGLPVVGVAAAAADGRLGAGQVWLYRAPLTGPTGTDAAVSLYGSNVQDRAGATLAALPDLDGDGVAELFVGGAGIAGASAWLVSADTAGGPLDAAAHTTLFSPEILTLPQSAAAVDLDRDGVLDLAVGAPSDSRGGNGAGAVFVFYGPLPSVLDTDTADVVLLGTGSGASAGAVLTVVPYQGEPALAVGQPGDATFAEGAGGVVLVLPRGI